VLRLLPEKRSSDGDAINHQPAFSEEY